MTDMAGFIHGGVEYPLGAPASNSALRDADPTIFYILEYYAAVLDTHIGARLLAEAALTNAGAGHANLTKTVATQLPMNPEPFLQEEALEFPVLGAARKSTTFRYRGQRKLTIDTIEVTWALPPCTRAEAERILPFLKAAVAVLDNRTEQGYDPAYTPSGAADYQPGPWAVGCAGLSEIDVTGVQYGGFIPAPDLFFPAIVLTVVVEERSATDIAELNTLDKVEPAVTLTDPEDGSEAAVIADMQWLKPPVLVGPLVPATGTKAGGTPITLACTGLVVGRAYRALFNGSDASSVTAVSSTSLACVSPEATAYPTRLADVTVLDQDGGESNTLTDAYTFTTP